ncbi:MAG: hypothetical protein IJV39_01015 [Ruminococcus sp.]|nr:hypothetical protein [Ruminococcus sp.]
MPFLFVLCVAVVFGVAKHYSEKPVNKTYTPKDMDNMLKELTGKSKAEKRKILKKYRRK